jgi:hypothetical protein
MSKQNEKFSRSFGNKIVIFAHIDGVKSTRFYILLGMELLFSLYRQKQRSKAADCANSYLN